MSSLILRSGNVMDPIVLTCHRVRQTFEVAPDRAGGFCYCPYCGAPHVVPPMGMPAPGAVKCPEGLPRPRVIAVRASRFQLASAAGAGFIVGVLAAAALGELRHRPSASVLVLEQQLQRAIDEKRQVTEAAAKVSAGLKQQRDDERQHARELQRGLDDAISRLRGLSKMADALADHE